jgi:adenosylhomocysteine nucleosidase
MQPIGLIAAMNQERDALLRRVKGARRIKLGPFRGYSFDLHGQACVLVTSGMGMRRAGEATRCLVDAKGPRLLISFGIAGAVERDLEIGDVVAAGSVCLLLGGSPDLIQPLAAWPEASTRAMISALAGRGAHLYPGTALTTAGSQLAPGRSVGLNHPVLEMETAGIARVAAEHDIPLLSIRAISDGPRAPIPLNLDEMMDKDANLKAGKLLKAVISHPGILVHTRQLMINTQLAADNAAVALVAALDGMASSGVN